MATFTTADEYLELQPEPTRAVLAHLREVIKKAAPEAEEYLSYQVPTYKFHGQLVSFAAAKSHCSFYVMSAKVLAAFKDKLHGYKVSGTAVHFTPEAPLPDDLVTQLVQARCEENQHKK